MNIPENFSTYCTYECLQLKHTKSAINASGKSAKSFFFKFVISPNGEINFRAPLNKLQHWTSFSESSGTHTQQLRWLALISVLLLV